ncbi:MAG TPA: matrixin family metalloprotease [Polyangiaceae bacterium]
MKLGPALPALFAAGLLAWTSPAGAYCRAKACDRNPVYDDVWQEEPDPPCDRDGYGCQIEGPPLHWGQSCLSFTVQKDGSPLRGIDYATIHEIAVRAFSTWLGADCGEGALPSFAISDFGAVECDVAQYNKVEPNANVIMFRDDGWDKNYDAFNTLALTTISYNTETAEIYDADIEIDSAEWNFVARDMIEPDEVDLEAVVTHEVGHFLGLSHSDNAAATMWANYQGGETQQRTLHDDDMAGICEIYPPGRPVDTNHCEPRHGFSEECQDDVADSGCAIGTSQTRAGAWLGVLGALAAVGLARRRRR